MKKFKVAMQVLILGLAVVMGRAVSAAPLYYVIDLSEGPNASKYPVTTLNGAVNWSDTYKTTKLVLRRIGPGWFKMGSPSDEFGRDSDETQHFVTISKPFYIGVFEVTQKQWELVMGHNPFTFFNNANYYATRPAEGVSYNMIRGSSSGARWPSSSAVDATSFIGKIRAKTGLSLDLPTEAQWEYACRAGANTSLNSGENIASIGRDSNMDAVGRYWHNFPSGNTKYSSSSTLNAGTAAVGSYRPNSWGLYDMHGNVWEWCLDWYGSYPTSSVIDPKGTASGSSRVMRGGGWSDNAYFCRSANRSYYRPIGGSYDNGFRLCCAARQDDEEELQIPQLVIDSVSWSNFELTLSWSRTIDGKNVTVPCSLYRGTSDDISQATCILKDSRETTYHDKGFLDEMPKTKPLYYWVVPSGGDMNAVCAPVKTRNRYSLGIGYGAYDTANEPLIQAYFDARLFQALSVVSAGVELDNAHLLADENATTQKIREKLSELSKAVSPGDLFMLYIATHGGNFRKEDGTYKKASLGTYDGSYHVDQLQADIRSFPTSVGVVATIMACHSQALAAQPTSGDDEEMARVIDNWLARCGFASCLGNVAWITSCGANENSYNSSDYTLFGQSYLCDGWQMRYADTKLINCGYEGGNQDGAVTLLEVAKYSQEFCRGSSDRYCSHVQYDNEGLLDKIVVNAGSAPTAVQPGKPQQVTATQGASNTKVQIDWQQSPSAVNYRIYRVADGDLESKKECICNACGRTRFIDDDGRLTLKKGYKYSVRAVSRSAVSDESQAAIGWTGLPAFLNFLEQYGQLSSVDMRTPENYESARKAIGSNGVALEDSYVAGLNPQEKKSQFKASVEFVDGKPVVKWTPDLNEDGAKSLRVYKTFGAKSLGGLWEEVSGNEADYNFFKVTVEMP